MGREASLRDAVGSVNYTWSHPHGSTCSRIDFLFTSRTVEHQWHSMVPCYFSDHRAIHFQGVLGKGFPPGPGSWKLNCALLEREEIVEELRGAYKMWKLDKVYFPTVAQWWEFMKVKFRSFLQAKGRRQECERRSELRRLQKKLHFLQDLQLCGWDVRKELDETKEGLKRHFEEESRCIIFRSKVEHLEKELFAECIRQNPEIRGITAPIHGRQEAKCLLYMDDVTILCADQQSVKELVQTCEDFGKASGAKVNCGKSETMFFWEWYLEAWRIICVKDALWFARNRLVLRREQVTTQDCRRLIHSLLRDYNILDSPEEED
ncbi:LOW QUALITY PROTEIN: uncharacterized protein WCC33_000013 [Rhinophrynus dorsalis]